ncbi:MAG: CopD family protein [Neisseria sp.]|nr:CopD family protein [Neisseria sp.]
MSYPWFKLLHIFFIISWFAGLFYLPRIYVNLAAAEPDSAEYDRLLGMSRRLYRFMTPIGVLALLFGFGLVEILKSWDLGWVHVKISIGVLLVLYHYQCWRILRDFEQRRNRRSHVWFRWFNEIPVFMMFAALYLVMFRPF